MTITVSPTEVYRAVQEYLEKRNLPVIGKTVRCDVSLEHGETPMFNGIKADLDEEALLTA